MRDFGNLLDASGEYRTDQNDREALEKGVYIWADIGTTLLGWLSYSNIAGGIGAIQKGRLLVLRYFYEQDYRRTHLDRERPSGASRKVCLRPLFHCHRFVTSILLGLSFREK